MRVCIAEKPSVAKEIAQVIGAKQRRDGYFEGNGYQVTWTFGHLCTLKEPHDYDQTLKRWDLTTLPIIPVRFAIKLIDDDGVRKQFNTIERLLQSASEVINCGDAGQEGEVIQRWVLAKAKYNKPTKRLWISSLTDEAIRAGFQNLKESTEFDQLFAAGSSRAIGDWLLGINATRLYTVKFGGFKQMLSIGRVQTPTLAMIVNRYEEIQNFKPEKYWELKTKYKDVLFSAKQGRFKVKEKGEEAIKTIANKPFTVEDFSKKKGKELPPPLLDLTSLQVECNKKLGLSADQTLKTAQTLYEKKFLTYPRVDTTHLPNDQYKEIPSILKSMTAYQQQVAPLLGKPIRKSKKVFDDKKVTDHHAIIPTKITPRSLSQQEQAVYNIVALRFLAAFYPDCLVSKTEVLGKVEEIDFKATGKQILDPGWRVLFPKEKKKNDKDEEQILPEFQKGESGPHEPQLDEKETKPPKPFTEATLLRAMETAGKQVDDEELRSLMKENGIGRPSTRANIIETLFRRKYIRKVRKSIEPTPTGQQLIHTIQNDLLKSAELTGQWESKLRKIEDGEYQIDQFMTELKDMVTSIVNFVKYKQANFTIASAEEKTEKPKKKASPKAKALTCPKCKNHEMIKGKAAYGCTGFKDKSCDFTLAFEIEGKKLTDKQLESLILKGKTPVIKGFKKDGKTISASVILNDNFSPELTIQEDAPLICPKCGIGKLLKGKAAYGCSQWKEGCNFKVPFTFFNKTLSENQLKQLIQKGQTPLIKGFDKGDGQKINAKIILDPNKTPQFVEDN
ncbi:type IA DNA topoisomerase [Sediminitomix flava]|uniref:DNA topoisomerase n=1 Tax=Sediminitomix flava TaxID=379075 RepID=A0A315ZAI8_SEDFL|nr:type IA DNA topoisomerase [Sediminitomix flava]PWJ42302.1 DNA topoisomerase-3 [Sediminitomix flava]